MSASFLKSFYRPGINRRRPSLSGRLAAACTKAEFFFPGIALLILLLLAAGSASAQSISDITPWKKIKVVAVATSEFMAGRSEEQVNTQIASTLDAANLFFEPLHLQFGLAGVQYLSNPGADPYNSINFTLTPLQFLEVASREWGQRTLPEHHVVVVFSSRKFGDVKGLSYIGTSCIAPASSVVFVTQAGDGSADRTGLIATLAHELGHYVGMEHDYSNYIGLGPSLMSPQSVANPFGFSQVSIDQFLRHAGPAKDGGSCFETFVPGPDALGGGQVGSDAPLQFVGGNERIVQLVEGQELVETFKTFGSRGATVTAAELPSGARFDDLSGTLTYTPGFNVSGSAKVPAVFKSRIIARSFNGNAELKLTIVVRNSNRAPVISAAASAPRVQNASYQAEAGSRFLLELIAADPDGGSVKAAAVNSRAVRSFPGRPKISLRSGRILIDWKVPQFAAGSYQFVFSAVDRERALSVASFTVTIVAPNSAPLISAPASFVIPSGGGSFDVLASDPEGRGAELSFSGLPAGSAVTQIAGGKRISFFGGIALPDGTVIKALADDGAKRSSFSIALASSARPVPLTAAAGSAAQSVLLYDPVEGRINRYGCDGSLLGSVAAQAGAAAQFISRQIGTSGYGALFAYRGGAGVWSVTRYDQNGAAVSLEQQSWGLTGDTAVLGDFDGDGAADLAVVRRGRWFIRYAGGSSKEFDSLTASIPAGLITVPFAGDIDGDGFDERIIYFREAAGASIFRAGFADGRVVDYLAARLAPQQPAAPAVADVDGDGRIDLAVRGAFGSLAVLSPAAGVISSSSFDTRSDRMILEGCPGGVAGVLSRGADLPGQDHFSSAQTVLRAALRQSAPVFGDLDGDRRFDLSVLRSDPRRDQSRWFSKLSAAATAFDPIDSGYGYPLSADLLGRGSAQLALFANGKWIIQDSTGARSEIIWGTAGDLPVAADYNGDGVSDLAVYRPSSGTWWIQYQGTSEQAAPAVVYTLGTPGDVPVPGDFDGDGAADIAVYRPLNGYWFIRSSSRGQYITAAFGSSSDIPVAGDFDGSGFDQPALFRPANGSWYIKSPSGAVSFSWGLSADLPVIADFDGNGSDDVAVYRGESGEWYVHPQDGAKADIYQFGLPGDLPVGALRPERIL